MSEEMKLEPCPFCGSTDCRVIGGPGTRGGPKYWAGCDHCSGRAWGDTEDDAIAAWNRRSTSAAVRGMREALIACKHGAEYPDELGDIIDVALSGIEGEDEQARLDGLAPISTDTKGTTK